MEIVRFALVYLWQSLTITAGLFLSLFLPLAVCLVILRVLGTLQEKRLWDIGGYPLVLSVAWIGTPVHEISHLSAAVIFFHKIKDFKLFQPNPRTGTLGYVTHSYDTENIYQAFVGNAVIALAPFFGGSLVLYLLTCFLAPQFTLYGPHVPVIQHLTSENMFHLQSYMCFLKSMWYFFMYLQDQIFTGGFLKHWPFYVFLYVVFCVSSYLSPSEEDIRLFCRPFAVLFGIMVLIILSTRPFGNLAMWLTRHGSMVVLKIMPLLYLAVFLNLAGCILVHAIWIIKRMLFSARH